MFLEALALKGLIALAHHGAASQLFLVAKTWAASYGWISAAHMTFQVGLFAGGIYWAAEKVDTVQAMLMAMSRGDVEVAIKHLFSLKSLLGITHIDSLNDAIGDYLEECGNDEENIERIKKGIEEIAEVAKKATA
jgi:hypothetical protein